MWLSRAEPDFTSTKMTSSILRVHAFEDEEVDRRSDEFGLGGAEREIGKIRGELFGEHAAEYRSRSPHGCLLGFGKFVRSRLFSNKPADLVHEKERRGDEQSENDDPDRCKGGHAGMVAWRGSTWEDEGSATGRCDSRGLDRSHHL